MKKICKKQSTVLGKVSALTFGLPDGWGCENRYCNTFVYDIDHPPRCQVIKINRKRIMNLFIALLGKVSTLTMGQYWGRYEKHTSRT